MSQLRIIHELLREEYAASRHIWWHDPESGKLVNDVSFSMALIIKTGYRLREGDYEAWCELAAYCLERSMSYVVMFAIGEYIAEQVDLEPLPLIDLTPDKSRKTHHAETPLSDEVIRMFQLHAKTAKPEPDRDMAFKGDHHWTRYKPRLKDDHPAPAKVDTTHKSIHWLF